MKPNDSPDIKWKPGNEPDYGKTADRQFGTTYVTEALKIVDLLIPRPLTSDERTRQEPASRWNHTGADKQI